MIEFTAWPKTPRLFRDMIITEKIDGTNAGIHVRKLDPSETEPDWAGPDGYPDEFIAVDGELYEVVAQSRKRLLYPGKLTDNFGFAAWVREHRSALVVNLGPGLHYGEWWGSGIQRGYGLTDGEKRFSLFNVHKYRAFGLHERHETDTRPVVPGLGVVPLLDQHTFSTERVEEIKQRLIEHGSYAAPGFMQPEGIIIYHTAAKTTFKSLIENDDSPKGE